MTQTAPDSTRPSAKPHAKENKARKISIYSIGIFTGQGLNQDLAGFMSRLAAENRGVYRQVN